MLNTLELLTRAGFPPRVPPSRSSHFDLLCSCPFNYFLRERLGLHHPLSRSPAASSGEYFHKRLEGFFKKDDTLVSDYYVSKCKEINAICTKLSLPQEAIDQRLTQEGETLTTSRGLWDAASSIIIKPEYGTFTEYLSQDHWQYLGSEIELVLQHAEYPGSPLVAQLDILLYNSRTNALWIVDAKTCDEPASQRGQTCPIEFQTIHYPHVLESLLLEGALHEKWNILPRNVNVGGMMHLLIQRPSIVMSGEDRDFKWNEHTLQRGPRKGQIEMRKEYLSNDPTIDNYVGRCKRWLKGEGEYIDLQQDRIAEPPVDISFTPANMVFDEEVSESYYDRIAHINAYATCEPHPKHFFKNASYLRRYGKLSELTPFYVSPIEAWDEIATRKGFVQRFRDSHITPTTPTGILCPTSVSSALSSTSEKTLENSKD